MQEDQRPETAPESPGPRLCVNCSNQIISEHRTSLCENCRPHFIKFRVPNWIKIFAAGIVVALLFSLYTFPSQLSTAVHLERGKKAEKEKCFHTAQKEFEQVLKHVPNNKEAKAHLMVASFYNEDHQLFAKLSVELAGQQLEDNALLQQLNSLVDKVNNYLPGDSVIRMTLTYGSLDALPDSALLDYLEGFPNDVFVNFLYAGRLVTRQEYKIADSVLTVILEQDDTYLPAYQLLASCKRGSGDYEGSAAACDHVLDINRECSNAFASKARTFLKQKKDAEALKLALHGVELNREDPYNVATLAISYHFNNDTKKRDELISDARSSKDSGMMQFMQYAIDVIEQKEKFRN